MKPTVNNVEQGVLDYLVNDLLRSRNIPAPDIEADLFETGLVDSLNVMRLVGYVGETFRITVAPHDLRPEYFRTVKAIGEFVGRKQSESADLAK